MKYPPIHYHDYLQLDKLLDAQKRRSEEFGQPAHDEWLFISVHQAYEVWFKQMLFEIDSVMSLLKQNPVPERDFHLILRRLKRALMILKLSLGHIDILETMTPLDFLDFRDFLYPASGFQSFQFRLIEIKLGLREADRMLYNQAPFHTHLPKNHQDAVLEANKNESLFDLVQKWLERTPFLQKDQFSFWTEYRKAVTEMLEGDKQTILSNPVLTEEAKQRNLKMLSMTEATFNALFDEKAFEEQRKQGLFRMSLKSIQAALFIQIYRDEPILTAPFEMLYTLSDLDETMTLWRERHAQMVLRMVGRKIGTGGSSGHEYLKATADKHKIFVDLSRLSSFLIPSSRVPKLPVDLRKAMNYTV